ncbi:dihydrolipoyl dehydrogenase [Natronoarchaeum mannanilyticum]|uniref:Dihydrolipoyl dehydrogenase n=1 Tax=Natronoarchaeum mannanilyticum TaxID=926360 RepID=A0AAV3TEK6_9EURY
MQETDVLVIGGGPAGYVAAIRAGQLGRTVTLVDRGDIGGTCLNHGCIPSKALIDAADDVHSIRNAEDRGIEADVAVDFDQLTQWKDRVVRKLTKGVEKLCKANGVTLQQGTARLVDDHRAEISNDGDIETVAFDHAIVATGSRPIELPGFSFDDEPILNAKAALDLEEVPDELVVVGGGYIGMELSTMFAKLGTDVTIVEMLDAPLPRYSDDLTRPVRKKADKLGMSFQFGRVAADWEQTGDGRIRITTEPAADDAGEDALERLTADKALIAVGRSPVSDTAGLDALGVERDDKGFVETDDLGRTNVDHVFATGDVAGEPMLAHEGSAAGVVAAETIAGAAPAPPRTVPSVVFTDPEIGTVGLTESEASEQGHEPTTGKFPFRASGRALTAGERDGFVKLVADAESGTLLGGEVVGPEASELIAEIGLAVEQELTLSDVATTVHAHPTLSEAIMEAADCALGHPIHTFDR